MSTPTRTPQPRPGVPEPTAVLRARLGEGMAFVPAKLVRELLSEHQAACRQLAGCTAQLTELRNEMGSREANAFYAGAEWVNNLARLTVLDILSETARRYSGEESSVSASRDRATTDE